MRVSAFSMRSYTTVGCRFQLLLQELSGVLNIQNANFIVQRCWINYFPEGLIPSRRLRTERIGKGLCWVVPILCNRQVLDEIDYRFRTHWRGTIFAALSDRLFCSEGDSAASSSCAIKRDRSFAAYLCRVMDCISG